MEASTSLDYRVLQNYLKVRGLPVDVITLGQAKIEFAGSNRCREVLGMRPDDRDRRLGIIFHYPDSDYAVVRWFGKYVGPFGTTIERKMDNPIGRPLEAYLSPFCDWSKYNAEVLYVCESALKALVVSRSSRYAIAGSGVWGLCPKDILGIPETLRAGTKKIVILFDNDWRRNAQVRAAIRRLGNRVKERWPEVEVVHGQIPDPPAGSVYWDIERGKDAGKWGVDDAIATLGAAEVFGAVTEAGVEPTEREQSLDLFNERYAVCAHPPCIIQIESGHKYSRADFTGLIESNRKIWDADKPVEVSKLWLSYEDRTWVERITYEPGRERLVRGEFFNSWRDDGPVPVVGDVGPFLRVYENAVPDAGVRQLLFRSLACILQNRGTKLDKSFIFVGRQVGTGKSLLASTFGTILGSSNYANIGVEDFASDFNAAFAAKELVIVDDLHRMGPKEVAKLKRYTTAEKIVVNEKNVKQYEIRNTAVFIITTNEYSAVAMDDVERRNLVVAFEPVVHYPSGDRWWSDYLEWLEDGGYGKIRGWLEGMNLDGFDPHYMPPMTEVKRKMIDMGRDDMVNWVAALRENPDAMLLDNKRSVYSAEEIYSLYSGENSFGKTSELKRMGHALGNYFNKVAKGHRTRWWTGGNVGALWAIRNPDHEWTIDEAKDDIRKFKVVALGNATE